uniref:annexin A13-like n=1 Tax=Ciona intestinalis TaxID=7719 RepID=UPI000180CCB8|nr:annexin A13-like [Ciona intestinalis]|eukprot:XP_002131176.3 annexin A13-like [Ciona intestinalis]
MTSTLNKIAIVFNEAMDGLGTNERPIIRIITRRSTTQRQILKRQYEDMFGEDLVDRLKGELKGDFEDTVTAIMDRPVVYDAKQLRKAMAGPGTNDEILIEILCARSNEKINQIRVAYNELFDRSLADDLRDETSGDFKHLLMMLTLAERDELFEVDEGQAEADAQAIYDAGENRWFGTDEDEFTKVLATRSYLQLRWIFNKYDDIAGNSFEDAIDSETSGNLQTAYKAIVSLTKDHHGYYAQKLHEAMRGIGTDEDALTRHIVGRSEIDLADIKDKYAEMFGNGLWEDLSDECSGDYKRLLLALIKE